MSDNQSIPKAENQETSRSFNASKITDVKSEKRTIWKSKGKGVDFSSHDRSNEVSCESYRRIEQVLRSTPDPFITVDRQWKVLYTNQRSLDLLHERNENVVGRDIWHFFTDRFTPDLKAIFQQVMTNRTVEEIVTHGDISGNWYEAKVFPIPEGIGCYFHDITETRRIQEELVKSRGMLEKEVEERTRQLRTLFSELTKSEQRERQKLADILHDDLQQTLVAAKLQVDTALREMKSFSSQAKEYLDAPVREAADLIQDAIAVSRSLSVELSPRILYETGLPRALEWLRDQMRNTHDLDVTARCAPDADPQDDDMRTLLFQSARELLFNIKKHAHVTRAELDLVRRADSIELHVTDRGSGIAVEAMETLLTRDGHFGLLGIQERIRSVGGRMEIRSRPGEGTRVSLIVPETLEPLPPVLPVTPLEREEPVESTEAPKRTGAETIRILLVDDHKIVREGLSRMLRRVPDIEVIADASNGQIGVEMAREMHPDVVVMDISMPVMNGLDATRVIASEMPEIKVLGLSMYTGEDMADSMLQAGAAGMLSKDAPVESLITAIRDCKEYGRRHPQT